MAAGDELVDVREEQVMLHAQSERTVLLFRQNQILAQLFAEVLVAYAFAVVGQISGYHHCGGRVFEYLLKSRVDYLARLLEALLIRAAALGICLAAVRQGA